MDAAVLQSFVRPSFGDFVLRFDSRELTTLSAELPVFYRVVLQYEPAARCVETHSLRQYFASFRDVAISAEALANQIADDVTAAIRPKALWVRLLSRSSGVPVVVEARRSEAGYDA